MGDKVIIRQVPDITIRDYVKGQSLTIQRPEAPNKELPIDRAKYFNMICDDIDKHQTDIGLMDSWSKDASQQMKIAIDTDFLADVYSDAHASNKGSSAGAISADINLGVNGTPLAVSKANVLETIVDLGTVLDEQNVPEQDRWIVFPAWVCGMILKSDLKDASLAGDGTSILRNGRVGVIDTFTIYKSNLLTTASDGGYTCYHSLAGHKSAISFAAQMTDMESLRAESTFGTLVRGLNVFGWETLKTESLIDLYIRKSS